MKNSGITKKNNGDNGNEAPRVYSYVRFSTPEQTLGDSERRQIALASAYAEKHGLLLDRTLQMADRGVSAFHGDNIKDSGALGCFLKEVEQGRVPHGSVLVVENVDRITRLKFWDAFNLISKIIQAGIRIHTTSPEMTYDADAVNGSVYALVMQITLAHDESQKKSKRVKEARAAELARIRREGVLDTRMCPKWLEPSTDLSGRTRHKVIPRAAKAIRRIFNLYLDGKGYTHICRAMNREAVWLPPLKRVGGIPVQGERDRWRTSYVIKLLRNRALVGEMQPNELVSGRRVPIGEPIRHVFPEIVSRDAFDRVQARLERNRVLGASGRHGRNGNLFTKIIKCAYCGSSMVHQPKGPKNHTLLVCDAGRSRKGCGKSHSCRYLDVQDAILANCTALRPELILPDDASRSREIKRLRNLAAAHEARLSTLTREIGNFENMVGQANSIEVQNRYEAKAQERRNEARDVQLALTRTRELLRQADLSRTTVKQWASDLGRLKGLISGSSEEAEDARMQLREHLKEIIERVEVFTHGFRSREHEKRAESKPPKTAGSYGVTKEHALALLGAPSVLDDVLDYCADIMECGDKPKIMTRSQRSQWMNFLKGKFTSAKGRFIRVHFKTKAIWDIVPKGSMAMGHRLLEKGRGVTLVTPPFGELWKEFERAYPEARRKAA